MWGRIDQDWVGCEVGWATRHAGARPGSHLLERHDEPARMSSLGLVAGGSATWLDLLALYSVGLPHPTYPVLPHPNLTYLILPSPTHPTPIG